MFPFFLETEFLIEMPQSSFTMLPAQSGRCIKAKDQQLEQKSMEPANHSPMIPLPVVWAG